MAGLPQAPAFADAPPVLQTNFQPSTILSDPVAYLPAGAADKFRLLQQHVSDLHSLCPPFEDRQAANAARAESERYLKRLLEHPARGGFGLRDDDPRVVAERRKYETLAAEAKRLSDLDAVRSATWSAGAQVLSRARAWKSVLFGTTLRGRYEFCSTMDSKIGQNRPKMVRHRP